MKHGRGKKEILNDYSNFKDEYYEKTSGTLDLNLSSLMFPKPLVSKMDINLLSYIWFIDIINAIFYKGHCLFSFSAATGVVVVKESSQYLDMLNGVRGEPCKPIWISIGTVFPWGEISVMLSPPSKLSKRHECA